jgi:hypothetical protein
MLDWDYATRKVHLSMPGYIEKNLVRFGHVLSTKPQMLGCIFLFSEIYFLDQKNRSCQDS